MDKTYTELFTHLEALSPSADLEASIVARVNLLEIRRARLQTGLFGLGALTTFGLVVVSFLYVYEAFVYSGFYQYFSLLFSGDGFVYAFYHELVLSLVESAPLLGIALCTTALMLFIWSGAQTITHARKTIVIAHAYSH